jgi:hypothetical protein
VSNRCLTCFLQVSTIDQDLDNFHNSGREEEKERETYKLYLSIYLSIYKFIYLSIWHDLIISKKLEISASEEPSLEKTRFRIFIFLADEHISNFLSFLTKVHERCKIKHMEPPII